MNGDSPPRMLRKASTAWVEALAATAAIAPYPERLLADVILARAETHGDSPALLSERESCSFAQLAARLQRYEAWALNLALPPGAVVALLMGNRPDYVACWLGLTRAGLVVALLNPSISGAALSHALRAAKAEALIVEDRLKPALAGIETPPLWVHGEDLEDALATAKSQPRRHVTISDRALLIYTSGTTGLPKAAVVSHRRILNWAFWFAGLLGYTAQDRLYNCLPLCHSVGGVVAIAAPLAAGGSVAIAERFSASRLWDDIRRFECTVFQYIGELCRYALAQPPVPSDGQHRLRLAVGNGLRADIWESFQRRFAIPQIVEFYAATEGTFSLYNVEGVPGSVGRIPPYLRHRFRVLLVKLDEATREPLRGGDGLCIAAAPGEAGEAVGLISQETAFEGYTDAASSSAKLLRDVAKPGDCWFRTGDLMRMDAAGHYFFVDRLGDTFRWKGENVSTLEVANLLSAAPGVIDAVVYGVAVPGADGKAGMALLVTDDRFDPETFLAHARRVLPSYAVPLFLRIGRAAALTETFKHRKQALIAEGFNPHAVSDPLYMLDAGAYRPLTADAYSRLTRTS